jgi:hypothetical protein
VCTWGELIHVEFFIIHGVVMASPLGFTTKEFWLKELIGIPFYLFGVLLAIGAAGGNPFLSLSIVLAGWYLYNLVYWELYRHFMLRDVKKRVAAFYVTLVTFQVVCLLGAVVFYS